MTAEQAGQFVTDYGPFIWFIFLTIFGLIVIVKAWPFISGLVHLVETMKDLPERLEKIEKALCELKNNVFSVEKEVTLNSGSSLKDAVKRIENKIYS